MPSWKVLALYIARQFMLWCLGVFASMMMIVLLLDYLELIRRAGNRPGAGFLVLLEMAALKQPYMAQQILPFAVLFGAMFAFWRMTRSNELVVARAAGVSVWQFLAPAVVCAAIIGVVAVTVFNPVASAMQASYEKLENRVLRSSAERLAFGRSGLWLLESDANGMPSVIHGNRLAPGGVNLKDVMLLMLDKQYRLIGRIDAEEASLEGGLWRISKGTLWKPDRAQEPFAETTVETNMTPDKIEESFASPETMSFWELPGFISLLEQSGFATQRHRLYYNALLARPFLLAAMVLIAATFSLRMHRRGGTVLMLAAGVTTGFALFFLNYLVIALGNSATIPVSLAAWTPAGVSWLVGASFLLHLEDG
ncbi:MAG TPA: LPS export ABC transporter permease LptG [Stellaceae bacterium]|nr:LPS export ABC transporter permease LptG [Stellaceae bacterium]